jgi:hypothetical protein
VTDSFFDALLSLTGRQEETELREEGSAHSCISQRMIDAIVVKEDILFSRTAVTKLHYHY